MSKYFFSNKSFTLCCVKIDLKLLSKACQKVINLRTQLLFAMANIACAPLNRPATPSQQQQQQSQTTNSSSSIRLLAGSHMSSSNGGGSATSATTNALAASAVAGLNGHGVQATPSSSSTSPQQTNQIPNQNFNMAFFQANPHLLNSAVLHSTCLNLPFATPQFNSATVFKEPQHVQQQQQPPQLSVVDKRSNTRILYEAAANNRDNHLQVNILF